MKTTTRLRALPRWEADSRPSGEVNHLIHSDLIAKMNDFNGEPTDLVWVGMPTAVAASLPADLVGSRVTTGRDVPSDSRLHREFTRGLLGTEEEVPDEWIKRLASIDILAETALRLLELRNTQRELEHLRSANRQSGITSWAALIVAGFSVLVAIATTAVGMTRDTGVRVNDVARGKPVAVRIVEPSSNATETMSTTGEVSGSKTDRGKASAELPTAKREE